jgi:hypothetical protein
MGFTEALNGLENAINLAKNAEGVTNKGVVGQGWPDETQVEDALGGDGTAWYVSLYPLPGSSTDPYAPQILTETVSPITLMATVAANVVLLTGAVTPGNVVHIVLDDGLADVAHAAVNGDTLSAIATDLASQISAAGLTGVTASASGADATINGATKITTSVGAQTQMLIEAGYLRARIQATIWAPDDTVRALLEKVIVAHVGTTESHSVPLGSFDVDRNFVPDGTVMDCTQCGRNWSDASSGKTSLFVCHLLFDVGFPDTRVATGGTIQSSSVALSTTNIPTTTRYTAGG